jgi:hypothetical protein
MSRTHHSRLAALAGAVVLAAAGAACQGVSETIAPEAKTQESQVPE